MRLRALLFTALVAIGPGTADAAGSGNPTSDHLVALAPAEQAKALAKTVGHGCVGTDCRVLQANGKDCFKKF